MYDQNNNWFCPISILPKKRLNLLLVWFLKFEQLQQHLSWYSGVSRESFLLFSNQFRINTFRVVSHLQHKPNWQLMQHTLLKEILRGIRAHLNQATALIYLEGIAYLRSVCIAPSLKCARNIYAFIWDGSQRHVYSLGRICNSKLLSQRLRDIYFWSTFRRMDRFEP